MCVFAKEGGAIGRGDATTAGRDRDASRPPDRFTVLVVARGARDRLSACPQPPNKLGSRISFQKIYNQQTTTFHLTFILLSSLDLVSFIGHTVSIIPSWWQSAKE
jgi:hypothetical protein